MAFSASLRILCTKNNRIISPPPPIILSSQIHLISFGLCSFGLVIKIYLPVDFLKPIKTLVFFLCEYYFTFHVNLCFTHHLVYQLFQYMCWTIHNKSMASAYLVWSWTIGVVKLSESVFSVWIWSVASANGFWIFMDASLLIDVKLGESSAIWACFFLVTGSSSPVSAMNFSMCLFRVNLPM